mmetsp:Transcript_21838/g.44736  ORF Transcript_21838/g.44736 Transcript_21838/m.44736 type:complete len:139 (+) Transcript_21838:67-483(+)
MTQRNLLPLGVLAGCALLWAFSGSTFVAPTPGLRGAQQLGVVNIPDNVRLEAKQGSSGFTSSAACALVFTAVAARALAVGRQSSVTTKAVICKAVKVGDTIPDVSLDKGFPPSKVSLKEACAGKKVVLVGLPGAFTPT